MRFLDLTRLVSRQGRPLTGIDRIEYAWARHLLGLSPPVHGLVRTSLGLVLLDEAGVSRVVDLADGRARAGRRDVLSRLCWPGDHRRARAEADLRRFAVARAPHAFPLRILRRLPEGFTYLNLGHANLDARVMRAVHRVPDARIVVLLHDTIPLDHPEFARPGTVPRFRQKMQVIADFADLVVHTAATTRRTNEARLARFGRVPPGVTARPGVPHEPRAGGGHPGRPYFVTVGTIEPRKNHALLLNLWTRLHATLPEEEVPHLHIVGTRGWADPSLLARLDREPFMGRTVFEHRGLGDDDLGRLLHGARALLFPSLAEGFGFPALEAARNGLPVVCAPLAVLRELLGDYPVYLDPADAYDWVPVIRDLAARPRDVRAIPDLPQWRDHFDGVLTPIL